MASPGTIQSMARLGYVRSIADQYEDAFPDVSEEVKLMMAGLRSHCDAAMNLWPEKLNAKDISAIAYRLEKLGNQTPMGKSRSIITYTAFGMALLEDMRVYLSESRKEAVSKCIEQLLIIHNHFSGGRELMLSLKSAAEGADAWTKTFAER